MIEANETVIYASKVLAKATKLTLMKNVTIALFVVLPAMLSGTSCGRTLQESPVSNPTLPTVPPSDSSNEQADGATIIGTVSDINGTPVANVVVSDGTNVVTTDNNGNYRINSDKSSGYVFISSPGDYTVPDENGRYQFFHPLSSPEFTTERHDFTLIPTDNSSYSILIHADHHLADRTEDIQQFNSTFIPDANKTIAGRRAQGKNVYTISLGDVSWEQFWKANNFYLDDAVKCLEALDAPVYHTIGNHDNNPYISDDRLSEGSFRDAAGPTYYSFNLGKVHYVVLDNIVYNNPGASASVMGDRSYDRAISANQIKWLKADLQYVANKNSPVVICGHVPFMAEPTLSDGQVLTKRNLLNMEDLEQILAEFTDITIFSGHYHRNFSVDSPYHQGIIEHNVAAVCGSLWWTARSGYSPNHICTDGTPGGYGILDVEGKTLKYTYKGIGFDENYQFRVYDLNTVLIDKSVIRTAKYRNKVSDYSDIYGKLVNNNKLLINIFNWGPGWTLEVSEEGTPLLPTQIRAKDPLHILSYECERLSHNVIPTSTSTLLTQYSPHFFTVTVSRPTSTVTVKVTDSYGRVFSSVITRPKAFNINMK